ncbi:hypothetical protein N7478_013225 [Penicillium angulare]|uniref:uncharacterized protein n=1 Tax=Penicillium angulare TaxID=116970 RepID=UPI002540093B|nr:uncharacterized protein N7478_013225 [Penicillium angulare]KAJ5257121.1 hypothetical protein N7478_013225 [Penicillium angulare]
MKDDSDEACEVGVWVDVDFVVVVVIILSPESVFEENLVVVAKFSSEVDLIFELEAVTLSRTKDLDFLVVVVIIVAVLSILALVFVVVIKKFSEDDVEIIDCTLFVSTASALSPDSDKYTMTGLSTCRLIGEAAFFGTEGEKVALLDEKTVRDVEGSLSLDVVEMMEGEEVSTFLAGGVLWLCHQKIVVVVVSDGMSLEPGKTEVSDSVVGSFLSEVEIVKEVVAKKDR